jgi:hypothetical protein
VELRITRGLVSREVKRHAAGSEKGHSPELDNATHWSCNINVRCLGIQTNASIISIHTHQAAT